MQIQTPEGPAEGQPLSDIQEYNRRLGLQGFWLKVFAVGLIMVGLSLVGLLSFIVWLTQYVIRFNILNNIVANCA